MPKKANDVASARLKALKVTVEERLSAIAAPAQMRDALSGKAMLDLLDHWNPDEPLSDELLAIFQECSLDPKKSSHHRLLLESLAQLLFAVRAGLRPGKRGHRSKLWTDEKLRESLGHFEGLQKKSPELTIEEICERMKVKFHSSYDGFSAKTISRQLQEARKLERQRKAVARLVSLMAARQQSAD
jgi:hypothetical protein